VRDERDASDLAKYCNDNCRHTEAADTVKEYTRKVEEGWEKMRELLLHEVTYQWDKATRWAQGLIEEYKKMGAHEKAGELERFLKSLRPR
jgi:hypothetical protein